MTTTPDMKSERKREADRREAKAAILVTRHNEVTKYLADNLQELGDIRAAIARNQKTAWESTRGLGITERREEVKHAYGDLTSEAEKLLGEVEASRAYIANIEFQMQSLRDEAGIKDTAGKERQ